MKHQSLVWQCSTGHYLNMARNADHGLWGILWAILYKNSGWEECKVKHNPSLNSFATISKRNVKDSAMDTTPKPPRWGKILLPESDWFIWPGNHLPTQLPKASEAFSLKRFFCLFINSCYYWWLLRLITGLWILSRTYQCSAVTHQWHSSVSC